MTRKIEKKAIQSPIAFDPLAGAAELPSVISPLVVEGAIQWDCVSQVLGVLALQPRLRCVIGSVLGRVTSPDGVDFWQPIWLYHCWLMTPEGAFIDPAREYVEQSLAGNNYTLAGDNFSSISLGVAGPGLACSATPQIKSSLVYAPGRIYYDPGETHENKESLLAWGSAAHQCWQVGGWTFSEMEEGLVRIELEHRHVQQLQGVKRMDAHAIANGWKE